MSDINPAAKAAQDAARRSNGEFGEQPKADPGTNVVPAGPSRVYSQRHIELSIATEKPMAELQRQIDAIRAESNRHMLAHFLYESQVPAGTTIGTTDWADEVGDYDRFDIYLTDVQDADGEEIMEISMLGSVEAGVEAESGITDWDEFKNEQGRIVTDLVYAWAEQARGDGQCVKCDTEHPNDGCADVGCNHNCERDGRARP